MITMTKASTGLTAVLVVVKPNMSLALAALALTVGWHGRYDRFALSRSVTTLSRCIPTVNVTATVRALSFVKPVSTSGWWYA